MTSPEFIFNYRKIGPWSIPIIELEGATHNLQQHISDRIANSTDTKEHLKTWKVKVASQVKSERGGKPWNSENNYAISVGLSFCPRNHGNVPFDVDNFIKPILDTVAAGLFCEAEKDLQKIESWNYPDSNFNTLLIHRLSDTSRKEDEGIAIFVSSCPRVS